LQDVFTSLLGQYVSGLSLTIISSLILHILALKNLMMVKERPKHVVPMNL